MAEIRDLRRVSSKKTQSSKQIGRDRVRQEGDDEPESISARIPAETYRELGKLSDGNMSRLLRSIVETFVRNSRNEPTSYPASSTGGAGAVRERPPGMKKPYRIEAIVYVEAVDDDEDEGATFSVASGARPSGSR